MIFAVYCVLKMSREKISQSEVSPTASWIVTYLLGRLMQSQPWRSHHLLRRLMPSQLSMPHKSECTSHQTTNATPQWGGADAEIKVPSGENTELKPSPFKAWGRSVCSHTCYAYCQGFLHCLFLPFQSIHLHFFKNLSRVFPVLAAASTGSSVGPQNKIGHSAGRRFPCWVPAEYKQAKE